jgi:hypothetical protein
MKRKNFPVFIFFLRERERDNKKDRQTIVNCALIYDILISREDLPTGNNGRWLLFSVIIIIVIRVYVHSWMR